MRSDNELRYMTSKHHDMSTIRENCIGGAALRNPAQREDEDPFFIGASARGTRTRTKANMKSNKAEARTLIVK